MKRASPSNTLNQLRDHKKPAEKTFVREPATMQLYGMLYCYAVFDIKYKKSKEKIHLNLSMRVGFLTHATIISVFNEPMINLRTTLVLPATEISVPLSEPNFSVSWLLLFVSFQMIVVGESLRTEGEKN